MTSNPNHSASGQALGYLHQCMWALVELGKRALQDPVTQLRLETLDDIDLQGGEMVDELLQVKHHMGSQTTVSVNSVDFWRTLNVWMDLDYPNDLVLRLVTTQTLEADSGLAHLRGDSNRNIEQALEEIIGSAQNSGNKATSIWRDKFLTLDETERLELVDRIVIHDSSPGTDQLDEELVKIFRYSFRANHQQVFLELLKGWWLGISSRLLNRSLEAVSGYDLQSQVADIAEQLKSDNLPTPREVLRPHDQSIAEIYADREFVKQLVWISLSDTRLWKAIRDYHRSYTSRSYWMRHQLLAEEEISRFAFRLHDEWETIFDAAVDEMKRKGRTDSEIVGQEILDRLVERSKVRIRSNFDEPWFSRGMFHSLADGEHEYRVGWHPEFEKKLEELLSDVTSG